MTVSTTGIAPSALGRPYPHHGSPARRLLQALLFGTFVFLFLFLFYPFGMGTLGDRLWLAAAGFGLVTCVCMAILNVALPAVLPRWYQAGSWTVGREILQTMLNLAGIGAANLVFYSFFFGVAFTAGRLLWFQFATALVGIFPVAIFVLLTERGRRRRFEAGAAQLQENLPAAGSQPAPAGNLRLSGADGKSAPAIDASSLLYAQSTGNYVDIFYASGGLRRYTLRSTLRAVEEQLALHPHFVRCHRRYIVNLLQVSSVSGNAQGYRLHLPGVPDPVPVARQHAALVKARLSRR